MRDNLLRVSIEPAESPCVSPLNEAKLLDNNSILVSPIRRNPLFDQINMSLRKQKTGVYPKILVSVPSQEKLKDAKIQSKGRGLL